MLSRPEIWRHEVGIPRETSILSSGARNERIKHVLPFWHCLLATAGNSMLDITWNQFTALWRKEIEASALSSGSRSD